jgi:serine/threonine protein phosphatase PrpC
VREFFEKLIGKKKPTQLPNTPPVEKQVEVKADSLEIPTQPHMSISPAHLATRPLEETQMAVIEEKLAFTPQLITGCGQSVGQQRDHNEDALFTLNTTLASDDSQTPFGLFIIADGMGGHQHGEVASGMAARAMASYVVQNVYLPLFSTVVEPPSESLQDIMKASVFSAHEAILKYAPGGGSTLTAALIVGNQLTIAHVGDSRAYLVHSDGKLQVLTRDHSLVKRLEELGQITAEEACIHPQRNVLYRALGQGEPFEPDITTFPMHPTARLLLCSDGLWGVIPEEELSSIVAYTPSLPEACQKLIAAANAAGGPDNISAVLVKLPE